MSYYYSFYLCIDMKANILKNTIIFLSAAYFLFAGLGINFVNYCCQTCANEGIESVAIHSCSALHHHSHSKEKQIQEDDITCEKVDHHPAGCHLVRLKVDTAPIISISSLSNNTIFLSNLFSSLENNFISIRFESQLHSNQPPDNFFQPSGREIITSHAVLLI